MRPIRRRPTCHCGRACRDSRRRPRHRALQGRSLVKHLAMRRTLWVGAPLTCPPCNRGQRPCCRQRTQEADRRRGEGGHRHRRGPLAGHGMHGRPAHLAEHGHASSAELRAALPELAGHYDPAPGRRWGGATPLAPRVLTVLAVPGYLIRGPNEGSWTTSRHAMGQHRHVAGLGVEVLEAALARARTGAGSGCAPSVRRRRPTSNGGSAAPSPRAGRRFATSTPSRWTSTAPPDTRCPTTSTRCRLRALGRPAARSRHHDHGVVGPRLVPRRAPRAGVRHQRQRGSDGVVGRAGGRRLVSGRRRPGAAAAAGGSWTGTPEKPGAQGGRTDRLARRRARQAAIPVAAVEGRVG